MSNGLLTQFASSNYGVYNKTLARVFGLNASVFLGELISEYDYWKTRGGLTEDNYFYSTVENIQNATTLTAYKQRQIVEHLVNSGIICIKVAGLPAKRYFHIEEEMFMKVLQSPDDFIVYEDKEVSKQEAKDEVVKSEENKTAVSESIDIPFMKKVTNKEVEDTTPIKPRRKSNKTQCEDKTHEVILNKDLADYTNEYLVSIGLWKSINVEQWEMRLLNLKKYSKTPEIGKEIVKRTWTRGYRDFYPLDNTSQQQVTTKQNRDTEIVQGKYGPKEVPKLSDIIF